MNDQWTDRLSDYLDGELEPAETRALEAHLAACTACAATLDELRGVVARAAALMPRPPQGELWPGVAARLDHVTPVITPDVSQFGSQSGSQFGSQFGARVVRRFSFTMPQLAAAGLALMLMSGGAVWILRNGGRATDLPPVAATNEPDPAALPISMADPHYDEAIADLQQALEAGRAQLDPETVKILATNLAAIDNAIEQSRRALATDPANVYLHSHLAEARQRKLALLRRGIDLINGKG